MSTTADGKQPSSVRIPGRSPRGERGGRPGADRRIRELTAYRLARLEAEVLAPARATAAADVRLRRAISAYVRLAISDPGIMTLDSGRPQDAGDGAPRPALRDAIERFVAILEEALGELTRGQGRTPSIDPAVAAQSLLGIIHWGVGSHRAEGRLSPEEASAQITFLALHGLISTPAPRTEPTVRSLAQPLLRAS